MDRSKIKFLVATDVHLGHSENHSDLGDDSYIAFDEVLKVAHRENVDFVLLGGDLFDEVNPTQKCIFKCLNILRSHIFGNRNLTIGVKGIQTNYANDNLNISLPIFTIHGNHDYPSNDFGKISVCDLLHASNYLNYFGKQLTFSEHNTKMITIKPLIFTTKDSQDSFLAIYGLGYIKDFRLNKMLLDGQVKFEEPPQLEKCTCIFILHQNRYKKKGGVGASFENCVHPDKFPKWIDLVIWGHEHEAINKVEYQSDLKIFQPGSTVITSYIEAESKKKQCLLITVTRPKELELKPIPLEQSFRPMYVKVYSIHEMILQKQSQTRKANPSVSQEELSQIRIDFEQFFQDEIHAILSENNSRYERKKPIIRIKIDYTGYEIIRLIRVEQKFKDIVANANKIFQYAHKKIVKPKQEFALDDKQVLEMIKEKRARNLGTFQEGELNQQIMSNFIEQMKKTPLTFFEHEELNERISEYGKMEGKVLISDVKDFYAKQLEEKCNDMRRNISIFTRGSKLSFDRTLENLKALTQENLQGKQKVIVNSELYEQVIRRYHKQHDEKQFEILSTFSGKNQCSTQNQSSKGRMSKSGKMSQFSEEEVVEKRKRSLSRNSKYSSEEEDCCARAEKSEYFEKSVGDNFRKAEQELVREGKKDGKKKKNVKFNDFK